MAGDLLAKPLKGCQSKFAGTPTSFTGSEYASVGTISRDFPLRQERCR